MMLTPARLLAATVLTALLALLLPAASFAAITTIGSPLSAPATLNTAENLNYLGTNTDILPIPEAPTGVVHTYHYGADTALWNTGLADGVAAVPVAGQAVRISLEGCAEPASNGPPPLTQIHFQDLTPLRNGGAKVNLSSQPFEIPVCGVGGASGATVSTYEPINLCVNKGDYVGFNDEGGFVEKSYQSGVRYEVLGAAEGSSFDSFIKSNGTGNGAVLSPLQTSAMDGFAVSPNEELMMQVAIGTGPDARYVCPGGTKDAPPVLAPIDVHPQTDGINHERIVAVAIYCRLTPQCKGRATITLPGASSGVGHASFSLPGDTTSHLPIRLAPRVMTLIRRHHGVTTTLVVLVNGQTFTQTVNVRIL